MQLFWLVLLEKKKGISMPHESVKNNQGKCLSFILSSLHSATVSYFFIFSEHNQRAKKVVSDSLGLKDFAIGLVIFVLNLSDRQVLFF